MLLFLQLPFENIISFPTLITLPKFSKIFSAYALYVSLHWNMLITYHFSYPYIIVIGNCIVIFWYIILWGLSH